MYPNSVPVRSRKGVDFIATLAQNAGTNARIPLDGGIAAGGRCRGLIRSIYVISDQQLDWEFWFWSNRKFQSADVTADPSIDGFLGFWSFSVAGGDGKRIGGAGNYYYYIDGLAIPYEVTDLAAGEVGTLNVTLVNRSAAAKNANSLFAATFVLDPTHGS